MEIKELIMDEWFVPPMSEVLEAQRAQFRAKRRCHRNTYDCLNAKVRSERVECGKGHILLAYRGGTMPLVTVLSGRTSSECIKCTDWDPHDILGGD